MITVVQACVAVPVTFKEFSEASMSQRAGATPDGLIRVLAGETELVAFEEVGRKPRILIEGGPIGCVRARDIPLGGAIELHPERRDWFRFVFHDWRCALRYAFNLEALRASK